MPLRTRLVLLVSISVSVGVLATAAVLGILAWRSILEQAEDQGAVIARLFAQSATVSEQVLAEVETILDREMAAQGLLASHFADLAEETGLDARSLSRRLVEITARSTIDEIWISDSDGRIVAHSDQDPPGEGLAAASGLPRLPIQRLLEGTAFALPLGIGQRAFGGAPTRYVGVRGVDKARAVLIGREQSHLARLSQTQGVQRLLDALVQDGSVEALWVFDADGHTIASGFSQNQSKHPSLSPGETAQVQDALGGAPSRALLSDHWISVAAAMPDTYGLPAGVTFARLSTAPLDALLANYLRIGGAVALTALLAGILVSVVAARRIAAPVGRIAAAAAAVDARSFVPGSLGPVVARRDELGDLARTFEAMAEQVFAREEELERQVRQRTIELQQKNEQLEEAKRTLEADLELAKLMQATILPQQFPKDRGWSGTALMTPALQMAGDFYDFFALDDHRTGLVIADVSGKGVAPAFFMAVSRTALQDAARHHDDPGEALAAANDRLCESNPLELFVTVFYAVVDQRSGHVVYANGGHNPPYVIAPGAAPRALPRTGGMALGVMSDMPYAQATLTLAPGETLFLFTDGVSEAMNPAGEEFGEERLEAVLTAARDLPVDAMLQSVTASVQTFAGTAPQSDDITCLVVRYLGGRIEMAPP